jgi:hypothetical protein
MAVTDFLLQRRIIFTHAVLQLIVVRKTASSECIHYGAEKMEYGG